MIRVCEEVSRFSDFYRTCLSKSEHQYTQLLETSSNFTSPALIATLQGPSGDNLLLEGHREWKDRDAFQRKIVKNGDFLRILTRGLRKLDLLKSVEVCNEWHRQEFHDFYRRQKPIDIPNEDSSDPYFYGSPFGRAWGLFHPVPRSWVYESGGRTSREENFATGREQFNIITTALSQSQRHILSFHISPPPASLFGPNVTECLVNHSLNAYSGLEGLTLHLDEYMGETGMIVEYEPLPGLQALLVSMSGLRRLDIGLPWDEQHEDARFKYHQVFPTDGTQWMRLTKLSISGLAISINDLFHLLTARMPKLRELTFSDVQLLDGRWEGVIEFLKTSIHLLSFPLDECAMLRHLGGRLFLGGNYDNDEESFAFRAELEKYVLSGGRHPCLHPDEDVSASKKYLLDLDL